MTIAKQTIIALTIAVLGLTACNNSSQQHSPQSKKSVTDTLTAVDDVINKSNNDSNTSDYTSFPIDSTLSVKVLTVGTFHSDEVWDNADKEKWFGLFQGKTGYYLAETKLKTKRVIDPVVDEDENEKTGWEVKTVNKDTSIILIQALKYLSPHNVQQAILPKEKLFPGDTLRINYLGINYQIYATGSKKKVQDDPEWFSVRNYKLYLTATINGQQHKSLLVAQPNFDEQMAELLFAGDIDGDGILDLIIDTSGHYNATNQTIYLSTPANKTEVVKPIGEHTTVGC
ncbi:hypothetical protein [Flavobacterium algicola]|uniref:hypothetical protein n=1 Tax=Flavobacterium algicola TaxID=556529 RepID=UPI001EFCEB8B|nr:hypothetical protein [Flavobacterium algicola]MCG9791728.1 hypothetical protein [Flavobacterium algicola]